MLAGTLHELLEERKSVTTRDELEKLALRYEIDVDKLESVARFVNSPSVDEGSVRREVDRDGVEQVKMKVSCAWLRYMVHTIETRWPGFVGRTSVISAATIVRPVPRFWNNSVVEITTAH